MGSGLSIEFEFTYYSALSSCILVWLMEDGIGEYQMRSTYKTHVNEVCSQGVEQVLM